MARFLAKDMTLEDQIYRGSAFDLVIIDSPAISADWLDEKFDYDGFVFLSKHAAQSGVLALTCHSTGNFGDAQFGGNPKQIAIPFPSLQKSYLQNLWNERNSFSDFQITIESTHHGPTALKKPSIFVEIGTTEKQWTDESLCSSIAEIMRQTLDQDRASNPIAICFGGTHYPEKFTNELLFGDCALGTVIPKHALDEIDEIMFRHIIQQNPGSQFALLDWNGLGKNKQKIIDFLSTTNLEIKRL